MKKSCLLILITLLYIGYVSSIDIDLTKESYFEGETLQAEITGYFLFPLTNENIGIYEGNDIHSKPVISDILSINNKYIYYALLPEKAGQYSLRIENARYYSNNQESSETFIKNFSIASTNDSYISINPGFISTSKDFSIIIKAYNKEQEIIAELEADKQKQEFLLGEGLEKTLYFSILNIGENVETKLNIDNYAIPVFIHGKPNITEPEQVIEDIGEAIEFYPKKLEANIIKNKNYLFQLTIKNEVNITLKNIEISSEREEVEFSKSIIDELEADKEVTINFTINSNEAFNSTITLSYKTSSIDFPLQVTLAKDSSEVRIIMNGSNTEKTCEQAGGIKCLSSKKETCEGSTYYGIDFSKGEICCLGKCKQEGSSNGWVWGLLIIIILGIGGYFFYKKAKENPETAKKISNIFKKRTEEYNKRLSPSTEVSKSLSKN